MLVPSRATTTLVLAKPVPSGDVVVSPGGSCIFELEDVVPTTTSGNTVKDVLDDVVASGRTSTCVDEVEELVPCAKSTCVDEVEELIAPSPGEVSTVEVPLLDGEAATTVVDAVLAVVLKPGMGLLDVSVLEEKRLTSGVELLLENAAPEEDVDRLSLKEGV